MVLALAAGWTAVAIADAPVAAPEGIARLIRQLGSARFSEREAASRALDAIGEPALEPLEAAVTAGDPETRRRAAELVDRIGQRVAVTRLLKPTKVALQIRDMPLVEAVKALASQTGLPFELSPAAKFAGRKITVQSDPLPVWDAVELFCRKADIHEWDGMTSAGAATIGPTAQPANIALGGLQGQIIINGRTFSRNGTPINPKLLLLDGPAPELPRHLAGAVRLRVLPHGTPFPHAMTGDEAILPLQISAEPRVQWIGAAAVRIDRALDDMGRPHEAAGLVAQNALGEDVAWIALPNGGLTSQATTRLGPAALRIARGERAATRLREVTGQLTGQVRAAETFTRLPAPFKAGAAASSGGVSLKLTEVVETPGEIRVSAEVAAPADVQLVGLGNAILNGRAQFQGGIFIQQMAVRGNVKAAAMALPTGSTEFSGIAVEDGQGRRWSAVSGLQENVRFGPQGLIAHVTATFKAPAADSSPNRIVVSGSRPVMVAIPFAFRDVPLP